MTSDFTNKDGEKQETARVSRRQSQKSLKIERNVPLPGFRSSRSKSIMDAMQRCAVGDCFFVPIEGAVTRHSIMMSVMRNNKVVKPKRFTSRTIDGGIRVWRVE